MSLALASPLSGANRAGDPRPLGLRLTSTATEFFGLENEDLLYSKRRRGEITPARWAVAYVLIESAGWSRKRVGKFLRKDKASVLNGYRRSQELMRTDPIFFEAITRLQNVVSPA